MTTTEPMLSPWRWAATMGKPGSFIFTFTGQLRVANDINNPEAAALEHVRGYFEKSPKYAGMRIRSIAVRKVKP